MFSPIKFHPFKLFYQGRSHSKFITCQQHNDHTARSRQYSIAIYPQATLGQTYSPFLPFVPRTVTLEKFEPLPVELAPGIDFPTFSFPAVDPAGAYLYTPPNPVPEASRGGLKLSAPPVGAESLYTNGTRKAKEPPPAKDEQ